MKIVLKIFKIFFFLTAALLYLVVDVISTGSVGTQRHDGEVRYMTLELGQEYMSEGPYT